MKSDAYCSLSYLFYRSGLPFRGWLYDSGRPSVNTPGKYDTHMLQIRKGYDLYHHITPKRDSVTRIDLSHWRQLWHRESSRAANKSGNDD